MRWFKHLSNLRNDPRCVSVRKSLGEAGIARYFELLEIIAEQGGKSDNFEPRLNLNQRWTNLEWLAGELQIMPREMSKTLQLFAEFHLIDPKAWRKRVIFIPQMTELLDEWTRRRCRPRASPERLPSDSSQEIEKEKEREREREKDAGQGCNPLKFTNGNGHADRKYQKRHPASGDVRPRAGKYAGRTPDLVVTN